MMAPKLTLTSAITSAFPRSHDQKQQRDVRKVYWDVLGVNVAASTVVEPFR